MNEIISNRKCSVHISTQQTMLHYQHPVVMHSWENNASGWLNRGSSAPKWKGEKKEILGLEYEGTCISAMSGSR